ncbi:MAG TPA: hypothetical protein VFI40_04815 [Nocardioides sp.]|nr:hypothetical protein [Nocardioides sp.]
MASPVEEHRKHKTRTEGCQFEVVSDDMRGQVLARSHSLSALTQALLAGKTVRLARRYGGAGNLAFVGYKVHCHRAPDDQGYICWAVRE